MIVNKAHGHGGKKVWYDRKRDKRGTRIRHYNVVTLSLMVSRYGSCWRLIIGPWAFAFGFRGIKAGRAK